MTHRAMPKALHVLAWAAVIVCVVCLFAGCTPQKEIDIAQARGRACVERGNALNMCERACSSAYSREVQTPQMIACNSGTAVPYLDGISK